MDRFRRHLVPTGVVMKKRWTAFILGLSGLVLFLVALHHGSRHLSGTAGQLIDENEKNNREVYAYVYSEVGDLSEFLDDENGRYGKAELHRSMSQQD